MAKNDTFYLTREGLQRLQKELEYLIRVKRPEIARQIAEAKAGGDISENAGYDEAKSSQAFLEGRIMELEYKLKHAVVIERDGNSDVVELGSIVTVRERDFDEEETYTIVGSAEADPSNGRISNESPIGRALMGHRVGDEVTAQTPGGTIYLQITQVR